MFGYRYQNNAFFMRQFGESKHVLMAFFHFIKYANLVNASVLNTECFLFRSGNI